MESAATAGRRRVSADRLGELVRQVPLGLAILLVLGIELRLALWFAYEPSVQTLLDTVVYVGMADGELFADPARSAGYSIFLRALHLVSDQVAFTIAVQHLLGIGTALLLYGGFRRLGTPVWVGVVAAAGVLLSLDQIFLEHTIFTESLFTFLLALSLYAAVRFMDEGRPLWGPVTTRHAWILAAAVALGLAGWTRSVVVPMLPLFAIWFAAAAGGSWRVRLGRAAIAGTAVAALLVGYAALQSAHNGFFGLSKSTGWAMYARTAQFADCEKFDPPAGTEALCETTPPVERPGPDFYAWVEGSPARDLYGGHPNGNEELNSFAQAAILAQPWDYAKTVTIDSLRYFWPGLDSRDYGGVGIDVLDIDRRSGVEPEVGAALDDYYADETLHVGGLAGALADVQDVLRIQWWTMIVFAVLGACALVLSRGRLRWGMVLMLGTSAALLVIPPATAIWSARYAVPLTGPMAGAAAVGAWLLFRRIRDGRAGAAEAS